MFTGIAESGGKVLALQKTGKSSVLRVEISSPLRRGMKIGESIAVNGVCLTVRSFRKTQVECDLLDETLRRTNLGGCGPGCVVNLERSLRMGDRIGGHFLSGHVDVTGKVITARRRGADTVLKIAYPQKRFGKFLVEKGSIGIDGVSLTVVDIKKDAFTVHLIGHTLSATNLGDRKAGDRVNLEFDMLAKYLRKVNFVSKIR